MDASGLQSQRRPLQQGWCLLLFPCVKWEDRFRKESSRGGLSTRQTSTLTSPTQGDLASLGLLDPLWGSWPEVLPSALTSPTSQMTIWLWGKRPGPAVLTFAVSWSGPLPFAFQGAVFLLAWLGGLQGFCGLSLLLLFGSWWESSQGRRCKGRRRERGGCWTLGTEVTWGWVLWNSWLAAFNAQPVSCEEGRCQGELLSADIRKSLHTKGCVLSFLFLTRDLTLRPPSLRASSHPYALFLPLPAPHPLLSPPLPQPLRQTSRGTRGRGVLMMSLRSTSFSS